MRRLLPASLLVLIVSGVTIALVVPEVLWREWFKEIAASALYVQNWLLAANAVDYLGADNSASPAQHYWSLSVEEQFYIATPLLIVAALAIAKRLKSVDRLLVIRWVVVAITAASFVYSVVLLAIDPKLAYFATTGRAWEFGAGGLLAMWVARSEAAPNVRSAASWGGLVLIAVSVFGFTSQTPFPGAAAAVPVVGTLLVIWAGVPRSRFGPGRLLTLPPVTWLGDVSYSFYLWHWPAIVLLPFIVGTALNGPLRLTILGASIVLAWLTKKFVEDPFRKSRVLTRRRPALSIAVWSLVSVMVVGASGAAYSVAQRTSDESAQAVTSAVTGNARCVGADAITDRSCSRPYGVTKLTNPAFARTDIGKGVGTADSCKQLLDSARVIKCKIGDTEHPTKTIALIGDSHAGQLMEALDLYGKRNHIEVITFVKTVCAGTGAEGVASATLGTPSAVASCTEWGRAALAAIAADPRVSTVLFANYTSLYLAGRAFTAADLESAWNPLKDAGKAVIAFRDFPNGGPQNVPECVADNLGTYDPCAVEKADALLDPAKDPMMIAARETPGVGVIDLTDILCDQTKCHDVVGGLIVYFDTEHLTSAFSKTLASELATRIERALTAG